MAEFARALKIKPQVLNDYLSGKARPGIKMQQRLTDLGCDVIHLFHGKTKVEIDRDFESMIMRKAAELRDEDFKMIDHLKSLGIDTLDKLKLKLEFVNDILVAAEKMEKYKVKKSKDRNIEKL